jgi:hypothetical protein
MNAKTALEDIKTWALLGRATTHDSPEDILKRIASITERGLEDIDDTSVSRLVAIDDEDSDTIIAALVSKRNELYIRYGHDHERLRRIDAALDHFRKNVSDEPIRIPFGRFWDGDRPQPNSDIQYIYGYRVAPITLDTPAPFAVRIGKSVGYFDHFEELDPPKEIS